MAIKLGNFMRMSSSPSGTKLIPLDEDGNQLDEKAARIVLFELNERIFPSKPKKAEVN